MSVNAVVREIVDGAIGPGLGVGKTWIAGLSSSHPQWTPGMISRKVVRTREDGSLPTDAERAQNCLVAVTRQDPDLGW